MDRRGVAVGVGVGGRTVGVLVAEGSGTVTPGEADGCD